MKKLFKGFLALGLAAAALASCGITSSSLPEDSTVDPVSHTVEFYVFDVGALYKEVEVLDGEKVEKPADPTRAGYIFEAWFDAATEEEYDFNAPVTKDLELYGTWDKEYEEDTRIFHLVGGVANTELDYIGWQTDINEIDPRSHLTRVEEGANLFAIELEIGYMGKFKVKVAGRPWDSDTEFDYEEIREQDLQDYLQIADSRNIQVKKSGNYKIEIESTYNWIRVTRLGDAVGEGVTPDREEGSILNWGLVGDLTGWADGDDIMLEYNEEADYYLERFVYLTVGQGFKLRVDNAWGTEFGSHENNLLDPELFEQGLNGENEQGDDPEAIKPGADIKVLASGYYTVIFVYVEDDVENAYLQIEPLAFALRGDALPGGWDADSAKLELLSEVEGVYSYEGTYEFAAGQFKVKTVAVGPYSGWDNAFGLEEPVEGNDNFIIEAAGSYKVSFEVQVVEGALVGAVSFVAV